MSTRTARIETAASDAQAALEEWLRVLPQRYVGKPLTQDDVTIIADASNNLRAALRDRRKRS